MNNSTRSLVIALISLSFDANASSADCIDDFRNFVCHYRLVILVKICSMKHAATFREQYFPLLQFCYALTSIRDYSLVIFTLLVEF
ncbi:Uncharacterised protein [Escherichia coli]|nr:Uncharacterised protein [Escherichia coli]